MASNTKNKKKYNKQSFLSFQTKDKERHLESIFQKQSKQRKTRNMLGPSFKEFDIVPR